MVPALLHVCRQTRAETATLFFSNADFTVESFEKLSAFARTLEPQYRQVIRTITLGIRASFQFTQVGRRDSLALFPSLVTLNH